MKKGLKFTPTPTRINTEELRADLKSFTRKVRLAEFFHGQDIQDESLVKNKSEFIPPTKRNLALDKFSKNVENLPLTNATTHHPRNNVSSLERKAIESLSNDNSIVIKEADKGGAVIIMDQTHYKEMVEDILNDGNYYRKLENDPKKQDLIQYNKLLDKHKLCLNQKELQYLQKFEIKDSQFYGLPKIHKSKSIKEACENPASPNINVPGVTDLKLRPIVAGPSCLTNRLSNFLDIILKPLTKEIPSFLKDTTDFLRKIPTSVNNNTLLVSFDIISLYSNINHELGLEALDFWINQHTSHIPPRFDKTFIFDAMKFILEHNTFKFNDEFYIQTRGTAMGTKVAPTYASLTIGYLEKKLYSKIREEYGTTFAENFIKIWKRFLDDCFIMWSHPEDMLHNLHNILNNLDTHIKFTLEFDPQQLPFLDCYVEKIGTTISTDIFYKPTDSKTYLLFSSCHPNHTKKSICFSLARRIKTLVSNQETLTLRFFELKTFLLKQNYPLKLIEAGIEKAISIPREDLLKEKPQPISKPNLTLISTHNPHSPNLYNAVKQDLSILCRDPHMKKVLDDYQIINSKRQPPNLKSLLTKARFSINMDTTVQITKCNRPNCGLCPYLLTQTKYTFKCGLSFEVKKSMDCTVMNVIYALICRSCRLEYIGETGNLRERMTTHRQHIDHPEYRILKASEHFATCSGDKIKFFVFPFYKMNNDDTMTRRIKEAYFIHKFKPALNCI